MRVSRGVAGVVALALAVATGCGDGDSDGDTSDGGGGDLSAGQPAGFEATPGYLAKTIEASTGLAYRCELTMAIAGGEDDQLGSCESDGERTHFTMDLEAVYAPLFQQLSATGEAPEELQDVDMVLETVDDSSASYMKAPFFAFLDDLIPASARAQLGPAGDMIHSIAEAGDGWAVIDKAELLEVLPDASAAQAAGGMDAASFFKMLDATEDVEELGTEEVDGEVLSGLAADVTLSDIYEGRGVDLGKMIPGGGAAVGDIPVPVEVWVDADGHIRRIDMTIDGEDLAAAAEDEGVSSAEARAMEALSMHQAISFSDYGDESIEVAIPTDATDITAGFVEAMAALAP